MRFVEAVALAPSASVTVSARVHVRVYSTPVMGMSVLGPPVVQSTVAPVAVVLYPLSHASWEEVGSAAKWWEVLQPMSVQGQSLSSAPQAASIAGHQKRVGRDERGMP